MRLDGYLKAAGLARKGAKAAIAAGRVLVDGQIIRDPALKIAGGEAVLLDGAPVLSAAAHLMLHKPAGYITAREDDRERVVMELLPPAQRALIPVGRLDKDVTGLLIITRNGQLAHRLTSPRRRVEKTYRARVEGRVDQSAIAQMERGIALKDFTCRPAALRILSAREDGSVCELTVHEGKYHQVKRMFAAIGHPVVELSRLAVGGVVLDAGLAPGQWRALTPEEIARLYRVAGMEER